VAINTARVVTFVPVLGDGIFRERRVSTGIAQKKPKSAKKVRRINRHVYGRISGALPGVIANNYQQCSLTICSWYFSVPSFWYQQKVRLIVSYRSTGSVFPDTFSIHRLQTRLQLLETTDK
jgi:hypothetical protein